MPKDKKPPKGLNKHPKNMTPLELERASNDERERAVKLTEREVEATERMIKAMEKVNANPHVTVTETYDAMNRRTSKVVEIAPRAASLVEYKQDSKNIIHPRVKVYHEDPERALEIASKLLENSLVTANKHSKDSSSKSS